MSAGRIALLVTGIVTGLIALSLLAGAGVLLWGTTQRNDDGFYTTRSEPFRSDGYAIRSDDLDLGTEGSEWLFDEGRLGTIRLVAGAGRPVFLGIGPTNEVARYLSGVEHDVVRDIDLDPFRADYREEPGTRRPDPPASEPFWVATGTDRLEWKVVGGDWAAVVMNADGSRGVQADISIGADTDLLLWAGLIVLVLGLLFGGITVLLILFATRGPHPVAAAGTALATPVPDEYPLVFEGRMEADLSRWLWVVKWLLLIPHLVVLLFLWFAYAFVTVIAFFAILFTERYPRSLFDFNVGVLRWTWRVSWYGYGGLATDRYPPFTLADVPDYPARLDVPYPERLSRKLVLVKWWLLAIPHYLVVSFFLGNGWWWFEETRGGPGLIVLLAIFAGFVLLFRGFYPRSLLHLLIGFDRWVARVVVYATLLRDEYPPFRLDR